MPRSEPFRAFGHSASFVDRSSGICFAGKLPAREPTLWDGYLEGALRRYQHHDVAQALDLESIADGSSTSLFWVALDGDAVVAGLRCHGPLRSTSEAAALRELATHPELWMIEHDLDARLADGVIEIKGVWVALGHPNARSLSHALARCYVHSMHWFQCRFALCTAADHAVSRWMSSGGRPLEDLAPLAYPDERYQTVVLWWDDEQVPALAAPDQLAAIAHETAQLWATNRPSRATARAAAAARVSLDATAVPSPSDVWKPLVLQPELPEHADPLAELLADPAVTAFDRLEDQVHELEELLPPAPAALFAEPPRWVFYPWRRSLLRILGPSGFRRLRLDRNRNKITAAEQERFTRLRVGVVGLSVGHVIAHALALEGLCGELRLADFDTIELSNLNRIPASLLDLGINKAVVAARRIAELDPYLAITVIPIGMSAGTVDDFIDSLDVLIEECDSLDVKLLVREAARQRGIPVVMETSDRGMLDVERFDLEPNRPIFHGLVDDLRAEDVHGLSTHDKVPVVLRILEPTELSPRMAASMAEIDHTVTTWPQLGGDVTLGAATVAAAIRRLGRGEPLPSGRLRIDLHDAVGELHGPTAAPLLIDITTPPEPVRPDDFVDAVVHAANLAPSGGNTQPWRFEIDDHEFRTYLVRERTSTLDIKFRGSYVAIGAAMYNARVAAASFARLGDVELFPEGPASDHVATLEFGNQIDLALAEVYPDMLHRRSNRHAGTGEPIDEAAVRLFRDEASREGANIHLATSPATIHDAAALLSESDRLRYLCPWLHREMMSELRWPGVDPLETGIDVRTLELDASDIAKLAVARRSDVMEQLAAWDAGRALGDITRDRVASSSALAVVAMERTDPAAYVQGGGAVERIWVAAERAGLAIQPVSPIFIYATSHDDFTQLVPERHVEHLEHVAREFRGLTELPDEAAIILVLRVSHAPDPTACSMRLPLSQALRRVMRQTLPMHGE